MTVRYAIQNDTTREYLTYTPSVGPMAAPMPPEVAYDASTDPDGLHFHGASWTMKTHALYEQMGMPEDGRGYTVVPVSVWMTTDDERRSHERDVTGGPIR